MSSTFDTSHLPRGLAIGRAGAEDAVWQEITELPRGRVGVAIGHRATDPGEAPASKVRTALRSGADPAAALKALGAAPSSTAVCAVIDPLASTVSYSTVGGLMPVVAGPDNTHRVLNCAAGSLGTATLPPGDTLLLCTCLAEQAGVLLDECATESPGEAIGHIVAALSLAADPASLIAVLYRQPPGPLEIAVPAEPANLAVVRSRLRHWLALAGVATEDCADSLLAVGEAASNATEHAVLGVTHAVTLRVRAAIADGRLRFTVSDDGRWKPAGNATGHRGHGIKLINALVDVADFTTGERGTTVEMFKEMRQ